MITRFRVQNYKALRDVTLDLTPVHVLIGPNDSGKTSILEAIAALCRSVDHPVTEMFLGRWQGSELVSGPHRGIVELTASLAINDHPNLEYGVAAIFGVAERHAVLFRESFKSEDGIEFLLTEAKLTTQVHDFGNDAVTATLGISRSDRVNIHGDPTEFMRFAVDISVSLSNVFYHRWEPSFLSLPVAPDSKRRFRMDHNGFGLALFLDDILGYDRHLFTKMEERFCSIFPHVKAIRLQAQPAFRSTFDNPSQITILQPAEGKGLYFELKEDCKLLPASLVSDGLLIVLAYLAILYAPNPPRVLLIEEPENGIHPGRLKEIIRIIKQLVSEQSHTQVVMTTHSPYVLHEFSPEDVTLCVREPNGEVKTRCLSDSKSVHDLNDVFGLGEIWTIDGDDKLMEKFEPVEQTTP